MDTVKVVVPDEPLGPAVPLSGPDDPPIRKLETAVVEVPRKPGWCDDCFDVHFTGYCPRDVLEAQFELLEARCAE